MRRLATTALVALATLAAGGCRKAKEAPAPAGDPATSPATAPPIGAPGHVGKIHVAVSVDWEGAFLDEDGLDQLDRFHAQFPQIPLTHFLCAGYFTKPGADGAAIAHGIGLTIGPRDELALHIHAWVSLVKAAGVAPRLTPSFLHPELMQFPDGDQGFEIELDAYQPAELAAIIKKSVDLFAQRGLTIGPAFRAGGSLATPKVLAAVREAGFTIDASASSYTWMADEQKDAALPGRIREVWPKVDTTTQPFAIATPAGEIFEVPDTSGFADYATTEEMNAHVAWAVKTLTAQPTHDLFIHFGFHQETANDFAPRLIPVLAAAIHDHGDLLVFDTVSATAAAARAQLAAR